MSDLEKHNNACERIIELVKAIPNGDDEKVMSEANQLADDILSFWKDININKEK